MQNVRTVAIIEGEKEAEGKCKKKWKNGSGGHLVFQNEPKNIPRQDILRLKIP